MAIDGIGSVLFPRPRHGVMKQIIAIAVFAPFVVAVHSAPSINIGARYEYMDPGKSTPLKRVRNSGDSTAFVKVSITEIVYADGKFSEQPVASVADNRGGCGHALVARPARSIIPAGGAQATRFLHVGNRDQEQY